MNNFDTGVERWGMMEIKIWIWLISNRFVVGMR